MWKTIVLIAGLLLGQFTQFPTTEASDRTGEQIYKNNCASCHGAKGEGTKDGFAKPLAGDRSVAQLSRLIADTMPSDEPGTCVGQDAANVASYIYDTFYSRIAQARNRPARIDLARLTVRQYQNTVADLIGSFRSRGNWGDQRGLKGEYFAAHDFRGNARVIERTDPTVQFDFGTAAPGPEKFDANEFSIRWTGSLLAPDTGEYEITVRTEHATRLYVNDMKKPLIDAWVQSGSDTEHRETIRLLGGRAYPLRLEFSKARQGVQDQKKPQKEVKASIALEWKLPGLVAEVVLERYLSTERAPEVFVVTAPFPPDDRSVGFVRGTTISKGWEQAATDGAIQSAEYVTKHLEELASTKSDAPNADDRLREFGRRFVERAFRRPLTPEQAAAYVDRPLTSTPDRQAAVKRMVLATLVSPRFLYRELGTSGDLDPYAVAARLSFGLWDSAPDAPLLEAAAAGKLGTREEVVKQAERMLPDLRTRSKLREFLLGWLKVDQVPDLSKDPAQFGDFTPAIASDLRTSIDLFLADVVWDEKSDFRRLFLSQEVYLNGRLAKFYGADLPPEAPFQKVAIEPRSARAGVLTHPYLMADFAYTASSSPIHRGVFLARGILGRSLRTPPVAVAPLAPDLKPDLTTRERIALQTSPEMCQTCHATINALGFTLEHYDAVGRYRDQEKGKPVDASGSYQARGGETVPFAGSRELAEYLARNEETHEAFVEQLFHHLVKQPIRAYGPDTLTRLRESFASHEFNIRQLVVTIIAESALVGSTPQIADASISRLENK